jgi:hypothetical membrane protein
MVTGTGRLLRTVSGAALLLSGLFCEGGINFAVLATGIFLLSAAAFDFCLLALFFGHSVWCSKARKQLGL